MGRITTRHQGGGHKRRYRVVDFKRPKDGVPAKVAAIEYDPNRSARIALPALRGRREGVHPRARTAAPGADGRVGAPAPTSSPGNALPLENIPTGHARAQRRAEARARAARWRAPAGSGVQLGREGRRLRGAPSPLGEMRRVQLSCRATVGQVGNLDHENESGGKAGRSRWKGKRPTVRGSAMNPVDHPHGGGEGKSKGGRHPVTPWGVPTLGKPTRRKHKESDKLIVRSRKRGRK
jgi:large subunit ribosomal protein L2